MSGSGVEGALSDIEEVVREADERLKKVDSAREEAAKISRDVIKSSGYSITYLHKGDLEKSLEALNQCESRARRLVEVASPYPELMHSGLVYNALSEYVEAKVLFSMVTERRVPPFTELGVHPVPYLQGLADVVGELRRRALDYIAKGNLDEARRSLSLMEAIYSALRGLDYPDAVLPNVRHKVDVARALVDSTKAMLVDIESRERLMKVLFQRSS
ncbi:MAG: haloacid dehalogenase [Acidilobus sp.]